MKKVLSVAFVFLMLFNTVALANGAENFNKCDVCSDGDMEYIEVEPSLYGKTVLSKPGVNSGIQLMDTENTFEDVITEGWENLSECIDVSEFMMECNTEDDINQIADAYYSVLYANPIYYYISLDESFRVGVYNDGYLACIYPAYTTTDREEINDTIDKINKETEKILFFVDGNMSDFEKVMTVHDYITVHYDYDDSLENHSITIMITKTGVCMSYTFAFTHVMNKLGIRTAYVSSEDMNHAWNLVEVDGEWYHVDLTWDDYDPEHAEWAHHQFALLSDDRIQSLEATHYDYDLGDLSADSTLYDDAVWHDGISSVVTVNDVSYWIDGNSIVNEYGETIYSSLDGGDGSWSIGDGYIFTSGIYSTLSGYNGDLYFNTDKGIYYYNPETGEVSTFKDIEGVCGIYIHENRLLYDKYDFDKGGIVCAGEISLGTVRYSTPYIEDDKLVTKVYKDDDEPMKIFNFGLSGCQMATIDHTGYTTVEFDAEDEQKIFFWDENLKPLRDKLCITNQ